MFIKPNKIIFKQDHQGIFRNKAYNLIVVDGGNVREWLPATEIINTDTGETVFSGYYSDAITALAKMLNVGWTDISLLSYATQKGRHSDMEIKIGPGHLTKGTKFKASDLPDGKHRDEILTVKEVQPNGPGSMVVVCEETEIDSLRGNGERVNISFHIDFVSSIVNRPVHKDSMWMSEKLNISVENIEGSVYIDDRKFKGHRFISLSDFVFMLQYTERDSTVMWRRDIDVEKLEKRLRGMGLIRGIQRTSRYWVSYVPVINEYYVDVKRAIKFLRKNPHWAFGTIEAARFKDAEYWDEIHSQFDDAVDHD